MRIRSQHTHKDFHTWLWLKFSPGLRFPCAFATLLQWPLVSSYFCVRMEQLGSLEGFWRNLILENFSKLCGENIPIVQPTSGTCYLKLFILVKRSTCFRRSFRPSSGAQNCVYSNDICQTAAATCCCWGCYGAEFHVIPDNSRFMLTGCWQACQQPVNINAWHIPIIVYTE